MIPYEFVVLLSLSVEDEVFEISEVSVPNMTRPNHVDFYQETTVG